MIEYKLIGEDGLLGFNESLNEYINKGFVISKDISNILLSKNTASMFKYYVLMEKIDEPKKINI